MNDLAATLALPTAAALVGLIIGLLLAGARRPAPAAPPARQATIAGDFVRDVAKSIGVDPRAVALTGLSVDAAVGDRIASVLFQAIAVDQTPEDIRRAIVDAVRKNVLAAQADADRRLTQALDGIRDGLNQTAAAAGYAGDARAASLAESTADAITAALGEWATASVPGLAVEVAGPDGVATTVPPSAVA